MAIGSCCGSQFRGDGRAVCVGVGLISVPPWCGVGEPHFLEAIACDVSEEDGEDDVGVVACESGAGLP